MSPASEAAADAAALFCISAEYAFARRLRHKMILSYLCQQRLHPTFQS
jgi:hypothetical protein